jgi:hypothetical protein
MKRTTLSVIASALGLGSIAAPACAAVVTVDFEDLDGINHLVPASYKGVGWGNAFLTYDTAAPPYTPVSGTTVAYFNYVSGGMSPGFTYTRALTFDAPVHFLGAWFAGDTFAAVSFSFYREGKLLGQTVSGNLGGTPTFLAGINAAVDEVRITGGAGNFVMDDLSYDTDLRGLAVPEPASWALMIGGFAMAGAAMRRQRRRAIVAIA